MKAYVFSFCLVQEARDADKRLLFQRPVDIKTMPCPTFHRCGPENQFYLKVMNCTMTNMSGKKILKHNVNL